MLCIAHPFLRQCINVIYHCLTFINLSKSFHIFDKKRRFFSLKPDITNIKPVKNQYALVINFLT